MATQSVALQLVQPGLAQILSDSLRLSNTTTFGGVLTSMFVGLYVAGPAPAIGNTLSQYTEANYAGYARQQITWGDQGVDASGRPEVMGTALQYQPSSSTTPNTIVGVIVCSALTGGQLLAVGQLTTSKVLGTPVDVLTVFPRFAVPGVMTPPDWGEIVGIV